jgi:hypothetical protein
VLGELCLWTMFLPTGRRYSIDSLRAHLRQHPDLTAKELADRSHLQPDNRPVVSLAVGALLGQLACIYLLNAIQKNGPAWRTGSAIHYVLHQDAIVTSIGLWVRGWITPGQSWLLTRATVVAEALLAALLLFPVARRTTRHLAILLAIGLHAGFALFLDLEVFTPAMLAFLPNLLPGEDLDVIKRWLQRSAGFGRRLLDASGGITFQLARLLVRFDRPAGLNLHLDVVPGRQLARLRELTVALLMILALSGVLVDNPVPAAIFPLHRPAWVEQTASYLQLTQRWTMFAPDVKRTDMNISVDAVTVDGRHVDPFNERANPQYPAPGASIPPRLSQNSFFLEWAERVPWLPDYHQAFAEWILRYPERTGRPDDKIVSFQAFVVEDDSPAPGERQPRNVRTKLFYQFPE